MLSVYFHTAYESDEWLPEEFRPMRLRDAAAYLGADHSRFAESRRQRAIAVLAAAGFSPARRVALGDLRAPIDDLEALLGDRGGTLLSPQRREELVIEYFEQKLPPSIAGCEREYPTTDVDFDFPTQTTSVTVNLRVGRRLDGALRAAIDPQNWDVCVDFFDAAYVAQRVGNDYPYDANGDALADPAPPTPGSAWSGVLFEQFTNNYLGPKLAWFKTMLDMEVQVGTSDYAVTYNLRTSTRSGVFLGYYWDVRKGGIVRDDGTITARVDPKDPAWSTFEGIKHIKLAGRWPHDLWMNLVMAVGLKAMGAETYEAICCTPS